MKQSIDRVRESEREKKRGRDVSRKKRDDEGKKEKERKERNDGVENGRCEGRARTKKS